MAMKLVNIPEFERDNNFSLNVHSHGDGSLSCRYLTKNKTAAGRIKLLLLSEENNSHFFWITSFQSFIHGVCRSRKKAEKGPKTNFCSNCMHWWSNLVSAGTSSFAKLTDRWKFQCPQLVVKFNSQTGKKSACLWYTQTWRQLMLL